MDINIKEKVSKQNPIRIIVKTLLYRILAFLLMFLITNLTLGNLKIALSMSIIVEIMQTLLYLSYENIWNYVSWGISN